MKRREIDKLMSDIVPRVFGTDAADMPDSMSPITNLVVDGMKAPFAYRCEEGFHRGYEGGGVTLYEEAGKGGYAFMDRVVTADEFTAMFQAGIAGTTAKGIGIPARWNGLLAKAMGTHRFDPSNASAGYPKASVLRRESDNARIVSVDDDNASNPADSDSDGLGRAKWVRKEENLSLIGFRRTEITDVNWGSFPEGNKQGGHSMPLGSTGVFRICNFTLDRDAIGFVTPEFGINAEGFQPLGIRNSGGRVWISDSESDNTGITLISKYNRGYGKNFDNDARPILMSLKKGVRYYITADITNCFFDCKPFDSFGVPYPNTGVYFFLRKSIRDTRNEDSKKISLCELTFGGSASIL